MEKKITKLIAVYDDGSVGEIEQPEPETVKPRIIETDDRLRWLASAIDESSTRPAMTCVHLTDTHAYASDGFRIHITEKPAYLSGFVGSFKVRLLGGSAEIAEDAAAAADDRTKQILAVYQKAENKALWGTPSAWALVNRQYLMDALSSMPPASEVRIAIDDEAETVLLSTPKGSACIKAMSNWYLNSKNGEVNGRALRLYARFDRTG